MILIQHNGMDPIKLLTDAVSLAEVTQYLTTGAEIILRDELART